MYLTFPFTFFNYYLLSPNENKKFQNVSFETLPMYLLSNLFSTQLSSYFFKYLSIKRAPKQTMCGPNRFPHLTLKRVNLVLKYLFIPSFHKNEYELIFH